MYDNPYEVDEVYVKPTEWSVKYHHPDCGYADDGEANLSRAEAEKEGYKPASCCLDGLRTNTENVKLTTEAHRKLFEKTDGWEERRHTASNILNEALTEPDRPDEYVDLGEVVGDEQHDRVETTAVRETDRGIFAKIRNLFQ